MQPTIWLLDALVLPSSRQGETWGLVVNESFAGRFLPCIVTSAVGCAVDFASFPDFQVIHEPEATLLAKAIRNVMGITRDFNRYSLLMEEFSIENCSQQITNFLLNL